MLPDTTSLVDIHSHLVPGVDDGARDLDDTLYAVEAMTGAGIRKILTTPHLDGSLTREPAKLQDRLEDLVSERFLRIDAELFEYFGLALHARRRFLHIGVVGTL